MTLKNRPAQDLYPCRLLVSSLKYINSMIAIVDKAKNETDKILQYSRETDEVVGQTAENFKTLINKKVPNTEPQKYTAAFSTAFEKQLMPLFYVMKVAPPDPFCIT